MYDVCTDADRIVKKAVAIKDDGVYCLHYNDTVSTIGPFAFMYSPLSILAVGTR
jgi:hypothetical protein